MHTGISGYPDQSWARPASTVLITNMGFKNVLAGGCTVKPRLSVATPPGGPSLRPALVSEMLANVTAAEKRVCKCACVSVCGGGGDLRRDLLD